MREVRDVGEIVKAGKLFRAQRSTQTCPWLIAHAVTLQLIVDGHKHAFGHRGSRVPQTARRRWMQCRAPGIHAVCPFRKHPGGLDIHGPFAIPAV